MDSQQNTFLPPPIDGGEASAPLAQPDDDFVVSNSAAGTPNTPADDAGTGSTVSPVSPVHLNRQKIGATMIDDDDDQAEPDNDNGGTDDSAAGPLPPPDDTDAEDKSTKDVSTASVTKNDNDGQWSEKPPGNDDDDDQVPVVTMSGILPARATGGGGGGVGGGGGGVVGGVGGGSGGGGGGVGGGGGTGDTKKNINGGNDPSSGGGTGGTATGNGENKSKEKSRYTSGNGTGGGMDQDDSGGNFARATRRCGTTLEFVILIGLCTILLMSVIGITVFWTMVYRGGYDSSWFPWPPQTPKQLLSVGIFTYMHSQNDKNISSNKVGLGFDLEVPYNATTTTTEIATTEQLDIQINNVTSLTYLTEERRFNLHPTLMTLGFVTLTGFSILVYRMAAGCSTTCRGTYVKLTHTILHLATVPCVVFGGVASMEYHRLKGMPHLYSVHSWMGLMTVSLFVIQFTLGFFTFVVLLCCRGATAACRLRCFAPIHATLGLCTFTLAVATCLTGLQQRVDFMIFNNGQKQQPPSSSNLSSGPANHQRYPVNGLLLGQQAVVVNVLGLLLTATLVFVTAALLLDRKNAGRNAPPLRYCKNGGQTFQLVPSSAPAAASAAATGADQTGRNGRM